jgi:GSH-dependent disulfide-bond oxidoreductase
MIDLYALTSPNVRKIYVMLEEIELAYKEIFIDVWKGDNYKPEFRKLNPNGKIPVIIDHDGPGGQPYTVFESGAILMYLADKTGRFLPKDMAARYEVIQWLMIQVSTIGPMFGQLTHFKNFAPPGNDYSLSRYQTEVLRLYDLLEQRLGQTSYLGGPDYTIADIATFPWTANYKLQGIRLESKPNLARWYNAIAARPAVQRALKKVEAIKSSRDTATEENKDRFFGRGRHARVPA